MKRFILLPLLLMFALPLLYGQAPQKMTAQMVLRDANGLLVSNQAVAVRVSIRRTTATGITVYKETHSATTNANGLYTIFVGSGTPEVGTFSAIDWGQGPYFIVSEVDPAGGTNYTLQTAQQLVSVPYALYADSASRCAASQSLRLSHDTLFLTGGGYVRLSLGVSQRYVDSVVAVNAASTARFDSLRRANDAMVRRYDSIFNVMRQRLDSVVAAGGGSNPAPGPTPNPACAGRNTTGSAAITACDRYVWLANGQTYAASTVATATIYGGNSVGCDSTVTLTLTIKQGTYNAYTQSSDDSYTWHGTEYTVSGEYVYNYSNSVGCPSADTLHLTINSTVTGVCACAVASNDGALPGIFSVSATKKVKFSRGNLQYKASSNAWRFAPCQKHYVDSLNQNISATYNGWIDLFGWGTSGFHNAGDPTNVNYYPYSTDTAVINNNNNKYGYGPSFGIAARNLTDGSRRYDWGYNAISNGGGVTDHWRTLSREEWYYLLNSRTVQSMGMTGTNSNKARYCKANINGVNGLILFPDTTAYPAGLPNPIGINDGGRSYADNYFDDAQWATLEAIGAVFLPAAGYRRNMTEYVNFNGMRLNYWLSTAANNEQAWAVYVNDTQVNVSSQYRCNGFSVRLVQDM